MTDDMKIPELWEGEIYVALTLDGYDAGGIHARDFEFRHSDREYLTIGHATVKITLDQSLDPRASMVNALTKQKEKVLAEAHIKAEAIQHKIDDLLQIEYTSTD